jgi:hypothetical protein
VIVRASLQRITEKMELNSYNKLKYLVNFIVHILILQQQQQIITAMVPTLIYNHLLRGKGTYQEIQVI